MISCSTSFVIFSILSGSDGARPGNLVIRNPGNASNSYSYYPAVSSEYRTATVITQQWAVNIEQLFYSAFRRLAWRTVSWNFSFYCIWSM